MKRLIIAASVAAMSTLAMAGELPAEFKNNGCAACHKDDAKSVGPSYKDVAKKYAGQADAATKLAAKVKAGGKGVWGPVPMPANPKVSDADMKKMIDYVLSLK
jgi:cytochrome c